MKMTFEGKKLYSAQKEILAEFRNGFWISPDGKCLFIIEDDRITNLDGETVFHLARDHKSGSVSILDCRRKSTIKRIHPDGRVTDSRGRKQGDLR